MKEFSSSSACFSLKRGTELEAGREGSSARGGEGSFGIGHTLQEVRQDSTYKRTQGPESWAENCPLRHLSQTQS